jgi:hypothetical protein
LHQFSSSHQRTARSGACVGNLNGLSFHIWGPRWNRIDSGMIDLFYLIFYHIERTVSSHQMQVRHLGNAAPMMATRPPRRRLVRQSFPIPSPSHNGAALIVESPSGVVRSGANGGGKGGYGADGLEGGPPDKGGEVNVKGGEEVVGPASYPARSMVGRQTPKL